MSRHCFNVPYAAVIAIRGLENRIKTSNMIVYINMFFYLLLNFLRVSATLLLSGKEFGVSDIVKEWHILAAV